MTLALTSAFAMASADKQPLPRERSRLLARFWQARDHGRVTALSSAD